jgi:hypothetical protein
MLVATSVEMYLRKKKAVSKMTVFEIAEEVVAPPNSVRL